MKDVLTKSKQLELSQDLKRKNINFSPLINCLSELDLIKNFKDRRNKEKELLADRSIEEIITQIDNYSKSSEYKQLKDFGVTFYSDIVGINQLKMRDNVLKIKGKKPEIPRQPKQYLNKNIKTLINIAKYSENGKTEFSKFQALANEENITDKKFYTHFNQACNLGYLKKEKNYVLLIKSREVD